MKDVSALILLVPLALIAGAAVPTQFAVNAQLRGVVGGPVVAAAASFIIGATLLTVAALIVSRGVPEFFSIGISGAPWWVWTGGVLGAGYVLASIILIPRLGAAPTIGFYLSGQMIASIVIDHFGLLGVSVHEVSVPRILGVAFVLVGVFLIQSY